MTATKFLPVFLVLNILWTFSRGDVEHFCDVGGRCILPCSFEAGDEVVIHWILMDKNQAHSYYYNKDQLELQDQRFRDRTSLFGDRISTGNASLQLTGVKFQDEGRYQCYTSTIMQKKESFVNLKVEAPVHKVNIRQEGNITCSSEGIYPQPELTWSTTPPSSTKLQSTLTVQQKEPPLYSISSSLILSDSQTHLEYSCTVKTRRNRRIATLSKATSSSSGTALKCGTSKTPQMDLIWRFNHSQIIVTWKKTDGSFTVSEEWKQQVKDVSESGDITLQDLSSHQEGVYTCELSDAEETSSYFLKVTEAEKSPNAAGIAVGVVVVVGVLLLAGFMVVKWRQRKHKQHTPVQQTDNTDMESPDKTNSLSTP